MHTDGAERTIRLNDGSTITEYWSDELCAYVTVPED